MKTRKTAFSRFATMILAAFMLLIISSFCTVTASAAEIEQPAAPAAITAELDADSAASAAISPVAMAMPAHPTFIVAAAGGAAGGGSGSGSTSADTSYTSVVNFFVTWIRRIGALVAFVGAVMFGLAIKNNDAEQKQQGLLTMVAGFVVVAVTAAITMFDLFT